jgi:acyl carrier protein
LTTDRSDAVVATITAMLVEVIGDEFLVGVEITPATTFSRDLELESIEFVALAERLQQHYAGQVDFTAFLAGLGIDEILSLTVGELARHITESLAAAPSAAGGAGPGGARG